MSRDKAILKEQVAELSKKELVDIVIKLAAKRYNYEFLLVNFLDKDGGEKTLFEEAKEDIDQLCLREFNHSTSTRQKAECLYQKNRRVYHRNQKQKAGSRSGPLRVRKTIRASIQGFWSALFGVRL